MIQTIILILYFFFGFIGNLFNIFLFRSPVLLRTSTSFYLLATSIVNLTVVCFVIPIRLFADEFNQDITSYSNLSCELVSYIYFICLALSPFFSVLACIDRWAASCVQVNRRRFASIQTVKRMIPLTIVLCCLLYLYIFFTFDIDLTPPPPYCSIADIYAFFGILYYLLIYSIIPPGLMMYFSINIILNVRRRKNRIVPVQPMGDGSITTNISIRATRRRLSPMQIMLVCQAITECVLTLPFTIINIISLFVENDEDFLYIYSICRLFVFINYASSFYINTLSSKLYRNEFKKLYQRVFHRP